MIVDYKKILTLLLIVSNMLYSNEPYISVYGLSVEVDERKTDGRSWDISGGAPDIEIVINGKSMDFSRKCRDRYRCHNFFVSDNNRWYIEVYDRDIYSNDLIGKGYCFSGLACHIGGAKLKIEKKL